MPSYSRIAIVTGATSGIGEALARKFIAQGHGVIGNGRNAAKLASLESELGGAFRGVAGDAASSEVLDALFAAPMQHFWQPASIAVANAGRGLVGTVMTTDLSHLDELLRTNIAGVAALLKRAGNEFAALQEKGFPKAAADIVVMGSVVGRNVSPFGAVYSATKFAVHGLAEALRREAGPKGVRVSLVEPGVVVSGFQAVAGYGDNITDMFSSKFGPLLSSEEIADAIAYMVALPPHVHVSDIVVRPTRQDYP